MNIEEIKVGETYYVRVKVTATSENRFVSRPLLRGDTMSDFAPNYFNFAEAEAFYKSIPETTPPKYDPCRKFKKGDIVKKRWVDGRTDVDFPFDKPCEVYSDEDMYGNIRVQTSPNFTSIIKAVFVELVTPVEELDPYSVIDSPKTYNIVQSGKKGFIATFCKNQTLAKQEAERYCKRLNEAWRKEHESNL